MSEAKKLREPTCYNCPHRVHYGGDVPMKKYGVMMRLGDVFCVFGKKARRFKRSDPKLKVPQWCPRRLPLRKLRIYDFQDAGARLLHERLCWDLGRDLAPGGYQYAVTHEADTDLTAEEFLERSRYETDAELLGGMTAARYQVVEIDDGLLPAFFYKADEGWRYEPYFDAASAQKRSGHKNGRNGVGE